jgi:Kef-type K+ transport system membrane component KefB
LPSGGVFAMSSTAVLTKLLAERMQLDSAHGREIMGVLLFQDLAVVPLLVIIPSLTQPPEKLAMLLGIALLKAVVVLAVILVFGQTPDAQVVPFRGQRQNRPKCSSSTCLLITSACHDHRTGRPVAGAGCLSSPAC